MSYTTVNGKGVRTTPAIASMVHQVQVELTDEELFACLKDRFGIEPYDTVVNGELGHYEDMGYHTSDWRFTPDNKQDCLKIQALELIISLVNVTHEIEVRDNG